MTFEIRTLAEGELITEALRFDAISGNIYWNTRPLHHFVDAASCARWNTRFAGKQAGTDDGRGYFYFRLNGKKIYVHRAIWFFTKGPMIPKEIDHIDGNPSNNDPANLRPADRSGNSANVRSAVGSTSKFLGVCWYAKDRRWVAAITKNRKKTVLGYFRNEMAAARAYDAAAREIHGVFARPNFAIEVQNVL